LKEIPEEENEISNNHVSGTENSFIEYSFDISGHSQINLLNISNPFKPFL